MNINHLKVFNIHRIDLLSFRKQKEKRLNKLKILDLKFGYNFEPIIDKQISLAFLHQNDLKNRYHLIQVKIKVYILRMNACIDEHSQIKINLTLMGILLFKAHNTLQSLVRTGPGWGVKHCDVFNQTLLNWLLLLVWWWQVVENVFNTFVVLKD